MANRIVRRGPFFTIYLATDAGPPIPYPAVQHDSDRHSGAFVDLRSRPDLIEQIHEAGGKPGLAALLAQINGQDSDLMTLGCDNAICPLAPEHQSAVGAICYVGSYVDIAFRDTERAADREASVELASEIVAAASPTANDRSVYEIGIEPMERFFERQGCFNLMLKLCTFGRDEDDAWHLWDRQCYKLADAFDRLQEVRARPPGVDPGRPL